MRHDLTLLLVAAALAAMPATAQTSATYRLDEATFNAGGRPANGTIGSSAGYRVTLDAIGDGTIAVGLASGSFHVDIGFVDVYRPPGEALGLRFADKTTLTWHPEQSVGHYDLYRDLLTALPGNYGSCLRASIGGPSWSDGATPVAGSGWFYLVTAENRLDEEGTKGNRSDGTPRPNAASCP